MESQWKFCDPENYNYNKLFLHSLVEIIVSLLWMLFSVKCTDAFTVCVKQLHSADNPFPWYQRAYWLTLEVKLSWSGTRMSNMQRWRNTSELGQP